MYATSFHLLSSFSNHRCIVYKKKLSDEPVCQFVIATGFLFKVVTVFVRINLVAFSIRVLDPGPPQYGTLVLRWRSKTVRVGWESVPRSRQTNRRARGRKKERESEGSESPPGICRGRDEMREKKRNYGAWAVPPAAFCFPKTSTGFQTSAKPFCIGEGLPTGAFRI